MTEPGPTTTRPAPDDDDGEGESPLAREVARFREREEAKKTRKLAIATLLVGSLGWLLVFPALFGTYCGHRLDDACHTGISFSATGLLLGVVVGFLLLWRTLVSHGGKP